MSFLSELKRRNVFRVAAAYLVIAWLLLQVSTVLETALNLPTWFDSFIASLLLIGFPLVMFFSWAYEITPDGIKKETEVERSESISLETAKKLDIVTLVGVVGVLGLFVYQQMNPSELPSNSDAVLIVENDKNNVGLNSETSLSDEAKPEEANQGFENKPSIAVIPFTNMANDTSNEPFTVGLHDDLLTHLSKISALKVISRTSVMEYKNTTKNIKQIAKELGVKNILEGGVQKAGNQIRLNVQLIDAETDEHLWAEIYDRELTVENIFNIQTEVSEQIAAALRAQLTQAESDNLAAMPTNSLEAYQAYMAGRQLMEKRTSSALEEALVLFEKATTLDPNYALAYVGQANAYLLLEEYADFPLVRALTQAETLIDKAIALEPNLAEAYTSKGLFYNRNNNNDEAEKAFLHSISLNPNIAQTYHWYSSLLRNHMSQPEKALLMARKAIELDPLSPIIINQLASSLIAMQQPEAALEQFELLYKLFPEFPSAMANLARYNALIGNFAKAIYYQKKSINLDLGNSSHRVALIYQYLNIADVTSAQKQLDILKSNAPSIDFGPIPEAQAYIAVVNGQKEKGLQYLLNLVSEQPERSDLIFDKIVLNIINNNCENVLAEFPETLKATVIKQLENNQIARVVTASYLIYCMQELGSIH